MTRGSLGTSTQSMAMRTTEGMAKGNPAPKCKCIKPLREDMGTWHVKQLQLPALDHQASDGVAPVGKANTAEQGKQHQQLA